MNYNINLFFLYYKIENEVGFQLFYTTLYFQTEK